MLLLTTVVPRLSYPAKAGYPVRRAVENSRIDLKAVVMPCEPMMTAVRVLPKFPRYIVEQLIDGERTWNEFLLRRIIDDQFQRVLHLVPVKTRRSG